MIEYFSKGEGVKKAPVFTQDQILQFLKEEDVTNRHSLIRMVIVAFAYLGGNRVVELKDLTPESVQKHPKGYMINFTPSRAFSEPAM